MDDIPTLITLVDLQAILCIKKTAIYNRIDSKHKDFDPTFPKPISLNTRTKRWVKSEISDWIQHKMQQRISA